MTKKTHIETRISVAGSGDFPLDMLRYDRCAPDTQADVSAMEFQARPRVVNLCMFSVDGTGPTCERWRSFNWVVLETQVIEAMATMSEDDRILLLRDRIRAPGRRRGE